ncbi:uncharacterized protein LOC122512700 isoform X2 [Leptopilina heterotoma]|nr:uncharacterized protein LOC122512700 isoform X2 [Leptopilina heterotoma]
MDNIEVNYCNSSDSSSSDNENNILLAMLCLLRRKKKRRFRVHPLWKSREIKGLHNNLIAELAIVDELLFRSYTRMSVVEYENLLQEVGPSLVSFPTRKDIINPSTKLMLTLRFLATGETFSSLHMQFRMGKSTVQSIIYNTLDVIWTKLQPKVMPVPKSNAEWKKICKGFEDQWQFPHCWGAMDGKHIVMQAQPHSGSTNFNYKKQHSLNLLAVCDAYYKFIIVDIGGRGRESDGGVLQKSNFGKQLFNKQLKIPHPSKLYPGGPMLPYFCVADEAFPLHVNIMRPFPGRSTGRMPNEQRIFNYRLSRARRTIENTFGIMASQWRIFRQPINAREDNIKKIVLAATCLHNYLRQEELQYAEDERHYCPRNLVEQMGNGQEIDAFSPFQHNFVQNLSAIRVRKLLMDYFLNRGSVPWQQERVDEGMF